MVTAITGATSQAETVVWENQHRQLGYATAFDPAKKKSWHGPFTDRAIKSMTSKPTVIDAGGGQQVFFYIADLWLRRAH